MNKILKKEKLYGFRANLNSLIGFSFLTVSSLTKKFRIL